jgi:methionyl-tRNA formyltransferase|tara:strand:- start:570 stop:1421 length:852 start_codon:yes stop_codon:yes gene_type:complete
MKIILIGGLTTGKIILEYLLSLKNVNLELIITHPKNFKTQSYIDLSKYRKSVKIIYDINANNHINKIKKINPDLIIVCGWSWLINKNLINLARYGAMGFHPSVLPKDRGRSVLAWQIEEGYKETSMTMLYLDSGVDSGDIIGQKKIIITKHNDISDILRKCDKAILILMKKYFGKVLKNNVNKNKQNHKYATYRKLRNDTNSKINWKSKGIDIYNKIRAISNPYPCAYFLHEGKKVRVISSRILPNYKIAINKNKLNITKNKDEYIFECKDSFIKVKIKNENC